MRSAFVIGLMTVVVAARPAGADPLLWSGPLSKSQAVARITSAGFEVRSARANLRAAQGQAIAQRSAVLPQVSVSGYDTNAHLAQFGMPEAQQTYASATASVPVINLAGYAAARSGRLSAQAAASDLDVVLNDAAFNAIKAYDRALLGSAVADARRVAVSDQEANVRVMELQVRVGKAPRYTLARALAALADAQQMAEDAAAENDEAMNDLKMILDLDLSSNVALSDQLAEGSFADTLQAAEQRALRQRSELAAARLRLSAAQAALDQARAAYAPTALLSAQTYNGHSNPPLGSSGSQVGVSISLPIIDGGSRRGSVDQASAALEKASIDYERAKVKVSDDVTNAWRELDAARQNLHTAHDEIVSAHENLRVARLRQQAGKGIELEVLDALAVGAQARESLLRAQERYDLAIAGVHHAAADPL